VNALERLADWVVNSSRQQSPDNLDRAVNSLIDTLACNLSGIREPVVSKLYRSIQDNSKGEVTAFGFGQTSAANAAMVNATAAHSQEFDDYNRSSVAHTSAVLIPSSLAVAEQYDYSGSECLDASIVGLEVMVYLGSVINMNHYLSGWHATSTLGSIGAAAAACRLMKLDSDKTGAALSLATSMIGGFKLQFGTMAKPLHAGLAARAGINAAIMAEGGITASTEVFDGNPGITSLWSNTDPAGFAGTILPESGKLAIEREGLFVKCYPCCCYTARAIDGMINLTTENNLEPANINAIEFDLPDRHAKVARFLIPENTMEARFSFPFCLSIAALFRSAGVQHFSEEMISDAAAQSMMPRVKLNPYETDPNLEDLSPEAPDTIRVALKDGSVIEKTILYSRGSPEFPLDRESLFDKFWACARNSVSSKIKKQVESEFSNFPDSQSVKQLIMRVRP